MAEIVDELLHLLGDPAHWGFELIADAAFTVIGAILLQPFYRKWLDRHNKEHH